MTPERFRQIRNLFEAALDRDTSSRVAFLEEASQGDPSLREEVERLLAAHQQGAGLLEHGVRPELLSGEVDPTQERRMEGRPIDHYEILRELGHGGMGTVYLAARTDGPYRKPVALKVVRPEAGSREIIERFRQERQILAALDHPNIARLLDGGTTPEGLPYLVMEYVEGQPIDIYCDGRKLSVAERLALFRTVCAAVEYAHQRGVVHRDLKPRNILVTADGTVKLLDFGVAKLLRTDATEITAAYVTRTGMHLMTPEYASPEQLRSEVVGAASDIYSLGVILYELLSGHRPYRLSSRLIHEVVRVISEEDPKPPSTAISEAEESVPRDGDKPVKITPESVSQARGTTPVRLRRELSGDLDKIALKALRKEPEKRYASAEAFGEDVRRHVEGLPVVARGGSVLYPFGRFLRRTFGVAAAAAVLAAWLYKGVQHWPLLFLMTIVVTYHLLTQRSARDSRSWFRLQTALFGEAGLFASCWAIYQTKFAADVRAKQVPDLAVLVLALLALLFAGLTAGMLVEWRLRRPASGPLLLRVGRRVSRWSRFWLITNVVWLAFLTCGALVFPSVWGWGMFLVWVGSLLEVLSLIIPEAEMREGGILSAAGLTHWGDIESYTWEARDAGVWFFHPRHKYVAIFRLRLRKSWRCLSITVPVEHKARVEAILNSRLPEGERIAVRTLR